MVFSGGEIYNYSIDQSDLIESVDGAWLKFARDNGAAELTCESVIGRRLWDFIDGSGTRHFYRALFERVRLEQLETAIPFRCDSPELQRYMELRVRGASKGRIELSGRLLRAEKQLHVPLINSLLAGSRQRFSICSLCRRVHAFGEWLEPETALQRFHVFETVHEPAVEHFVCDQCKELLDHEPA